MSIKRSRQRLHLGLSPIGMICRMDVQNFIQTKNPEALTPPKIAKRLGYIVSYTRLGKALLPTTLMLSIISDVDDHRNTSSSLRSVQFVSSPGCLSNDKKTVPDLEKFTGKVEDYYS